MSRPYNPSPRPTFDGPALIPCAGVTRHVWGDPAAGEVADSTTPRPSTCTPRVRAAGGAQFPHSPEFRTMFGADEMLHVLRGRWCRAEPERGEVQRVPPDRA